MRDEMAVVRSYMSRPPVNVESLITELGIALIVEKLPENHSGRIETDGDFYTIYINANDGRQRQRFTAAHELAHYLLHRDLLEERGGLNRHIDVLYMGGGKFNPSRPFSPQHEIQANRYAAEILMPSALVREKYDSERDNVYELAELFGVSQPAMKIRLQSMGLRAPD
jgi:Zn-dependent peptidase ImmA (M78 family)